MGVKLLFGIHCHQPVENFYEVVDEAVEKAYKPFFKVVSKKDFRFSVHFSGWLLEYIRFYHKDLFSLMKKCADKGQIEFFSGGFYEPVLASIPSDDRKYQIEKLNRFIKEHFGQKPEGLWLTERVWDDTIIKDVVDVGIKYVMVDDYHFISVGFKKDQLHGYFFTESEGKKLGVFPIDKTLRYITPFKPVDRVMEYLSSIPDGKCGVIFDDGEKFGIWPKTYWWVYEKGWLEEFIEAVEGSDKVESSLYKDFFHKEKGEGLVYLPTTSYYEMGEWALPPESFREIEFLKEKLEKEGLSEYFEKYVKGSIWKNFFVKYPEANRIHKRFLDLSIKNKDIKENTAFLEPLLASQCNDVLWHGVFGGLYLPNLRNNAYRFLIKAEKEAEKLKKKSDYTQIGDTFLDGYGDIKVSTKNLLAFISLKEGGQIVELSLKNEEFNLQNTLTRRKEGYHYKFLEKPKENHKTEEGISTIHEAELEISTEEIKDKLIYDWYNKNSFIDHITDKNISLESFYRCSFREYGDFANQPFSLVDVKNGEILLKRDGGIYKDRKYETVLKKFYKIQDNTVEYVVDIETENQDENIYLLELNLHFAIFEKTLLNGSPLSKSEFKNIQLVKIEDPFTNKTIQIRFDRAVDMFVSPVETISQSEKGIDLTIQGYSLGFYLPFIEKLRCGCTVEIK
jgi:hypothetical protein